MKFRRRISTIGLVLAVAFAVPGTAALANPGHWSCSQGRFVQVSSTSTGRTSHLAPTTSAPIAIFENGQTFLTRSSVSGRQSTSWTAVTTLTMRRAGASCSGL